MDCPRCQTEMRSGICPNCGYSRADSRSGTEMSKVLKHSATSIAALLFLGYLIVNIAMMVWSIDMILPKTLTNKTIIYVVFPIPIGLKSIGGYWFTMFYVFLILSIVSSLITIFYKGGKDLLLYFKELVTGKFSKLEKNDRIATPFLRLVCIFTALLFISYLYLMLLRFTGKSIETPGFEKLPLWERVYSLTRASVWEEVVVRVVFIGLPMAIYTLAKKRKNWKRFILGGFGLKNRLGAVLIVISSLIFAAAHLPGWNIYKMFPTFIAGFAFGYLFVKDGIYSAILLHFFWDFLSVPDMMMNIPNFNTILSLMILVWMVVGAFYTYYFIKRFIAWMQGGHKKERKKKKVSKKEEVEEKTSGVDIGYVCGNCGYNNAKYTDEGKLKCKRCGSESEPKSKYSQQRSGGVSSGGGWPPS